MVRFYNRTGAERHDRPAASVINAHIDTRRRIVSVTERITVRIPETPRQRHNQGHLALDRLTRCPAHHNNAIPATTMTISGTKTGTRHVSLLRMTLRHVSEY